MDKRSLTETEIRTEFITPAIQGAQWQPHQIREELSLTAGRIRVRGRQCSRAKGRRADYVLYHKPNIPIAVVEAKDNNHGVGDGMQQGSSLLPASSHQPDHRSDRPRPTW